MKRTLTLLRPLLLILAIAVTAGATAFATPPAAPVNLQGSVVAGPNGGKSIELTWEMPNPNNGGSHDGFNVSLGVAQNGMIYFRQVAHQIDSSFLGKGSYTMPVNATGTYYFFVNSYNANEMSPSSDTIAVIVTIDPIGGKEITFNPSYYYQKGIINTLLTFTVHATAANGNSLWYGLGGDAPAGVMIDSVTGEISWTPTQNGTVVFNAVAGYMGEDSARASVRCTVDVSDGLIRTLISGTLLDSAGNTVMSGTVKLYTEVRNPQGTNTFEFVSDFPVRQGYFSFSVTENTVYILEGLPDDSTLSAAYYKENGLGVTNWQDATHITAAPNGGTNIPIKFKLPYADGHHGSNHLRGVVYNGSGRTKEGSGSTLLGSTPLEGAIVMAFDANGLISSWAMTSAYGSYDVANLGASSYMISVSKVGFKSTTRSVTFAADNGTTLDFDEVIIDPIGSASSVPVTSVASSGITASPNPATAGTTLSFTAKGGTGTIRMVSSDGRTVMTRAITTLAGPNRIEVTTEGIADGYYLVQLTVGDESMILPVVVAR